MNLAQWIRDKPRYAVLRSAIARAASVVTCSEWVGRELARSGIDSQCIVLPVPRPGPEYARTPAPEPRILFCGRLDVEKGVEQLLRAFAIVAVENQSAALRIVGRGPERDRLEELTRELGVAQKVTFLGWLGPAEIERELSEAWVLAAPSLWAEPLGLVAIEAMVRGVPVVASASGGFAETVEDGVSGRLVPNGDVSALAEKLIAIVAGRDFSHGIPQEVVRRVAERHDVARHVALMRSKFSEVLFR